MQSAALFVKSEPDTAGAIQIAGVCIIRTVTACGHSEAKIPTHFRIIFAIKKI